jgi:hypothetical protein
MNGIYLKKAQIIKEIRKAGKIAISFGSSELEILVDKKDLIQEIERQIDMDQEYSIFERDGYRIVFYDSKY